MMFKRRNLYQNIYCSVCVKWVSEKAITFHLKSKCHKKRRLGINLKTCGIQKSKCKFTDESGSEIGFVFSGNTIASDDTVTQSVSPDLFESYSQQDTDSSHKSNNTSDIELCGCGNKNGHLWAPTSQCFSEYVSETSDENEGTKPANVCDANDTHDFPLSLLSGKFKETSCNEEHYGQLSFLACALCKPNSYKIYEESQSISFHVDQDCAKDHQL